MNNFIDLFHGNNSFYGYESNVLILKTVIRLAHEAAFKN